MWDDDRDRGHDYPVDDLPTASLRITARMAALRASRACEPSQPDQSSARKRPTPRPLPDSPYATARVSTVRPYSTGAPTLITAVQRRVTAGPSSATTKEPRVTAGPSRTTTMRPRVTARMPTTTERHTAPMRRVRPEEAALVQRATQELAIIESLCERALVLPEDPSDKPTDVTILPAARTPSLLLPLIRADRRPRSWYAVAGAWGLAVLLIVAVLATIGPLAGQTTRQTFAPRAVLFASEDNIPHPSGPWDTSAGSLNFLGVGGGAGPGVQAPGTAGLPVSETSKANPTPVPAPPAPAVRAAPAAPAKAPAPAPAPPPAPSGISPAPFSPWPPSNPYMFVPGHPGYAVTEPSPDNYWWAWGQCTWWAQHTRPDENLTHMGNAQFWASGAAARGYHVSSVARAGATVVFQPGVQGAGGAGHVAHVIAVYPDGWFLVSEMNFFWNGGGWARVDYRYAHQGPGVAFIY